MEKQTFPLFKNLGHGQFGEATSMAGLGLATAEMSGWSNAIVDLDNDGWKDLYVARSNVIDNVALFTQRQYAESNTVFRSLGNGKFQDVTSTTGPAFQIPSVNRGAAFGDLDNDGRMDLVVNVLNGKAKVFHNTTKNENHWVLLKLTGVKSNRMGIGARIRLTAADGTMQYNHVTTSTGYASSSDPRPLWSGGVEGSQGNSDPVAQRPHPGAARRRCGSRNGNHRAESLKGDLWQ